MTEILKTESGYYLQRRGDRCILYSPKDDPITIVEMGTNDYTDEDMAYILKAALGDDMNGGNTNEV